MPIYSLLHLTGYEAMTMEEIKNFRQMGSLTAGHPEVGHTPGVETTTGPLGQGIANSVGFALAERILAAQYGDNVVNHRTWVIAGDGCLMEGVNESGRISLAGHLSSTNWLSCGTTTRSPLMATLNYQQRRPARVSRLRAGTHIAVMVTMLPASKRR